MHRLRRRPRKRAAASSAAVTRADEGRRIRSNAGASVSASAPRADHDEVHSCLALLISKGPKEEAMEETSTVPRIPLNESLDVVTKQRSVTVVHRRWVWKIWPNVTRWAMSGADGDLYPASTEKALEDDFEDLCDAANERRCMPQFVSLACKRQGRPGRPAARIIKVGAKPRSARGPTTEMKTKTSCSPVPSKRATQEGVESTENGTAAASWSEVPATRATREGVGVTENGTTVIRRSENFFSPLREDHNSLNAEVDHNEGVTRLSPTATPFEPTSLPSLRRTTVTSGATAPEFMPSSRPASHGGDLQLDDKPSDPNKLTAEKTEDNRPSFRELIDGDTELLRRNGLAKLIRQRRADSDFATLENVNHPAWSLLKFYRERGAPVKFSTKPWSREQIDGALQRGAHRSCFEHLEFLEDEFVDMIQKGQWIVLPASEVKNLTGFRLSPPGVVPQMGRRPRWIVDYTWSGVNADTLPLAPVEAMQFGHALDRILREIMLADPRLGPVKLLKVDLSDGFYRVHLNVDDIAKLGVVFPTRPGEEPLVALPLVLPMGWKNSPPIFSALTETIADLANWRIKHGYPSPPHHLDDEAASIVPDHPLTGMPMIPEDSKDEESDNSSDKPAFTGDLTSQANQSCRHATASTPSIKIPPRPIESNIEPRSTHAEPQVDRSHPHAGKEPEASVETPDVPSQHPPRLGVEAPTSTRGYNSKCHPSVPVPLDRDPSLPSQSRPLSYIDIFVDDFIGLAQDLTNERRVRRILLHAIDDVIRPLSESDNVHRREPVSLKKLRQGDCSWSTVKLILGWVIDTVAMTIHLPPHRLERLGEILASIPATQKRTSVKKWHKVLGELRSMSLALPGARNLFSHMQHALSSKLKGRVALNKGVHDALDDFRWILTDIASRPTRIAEVVPLLASAEGHHDASGKGAGGIWFPAPQLNPRQGYSQKPVVWRFEWPQHIIDRLVTSENPSGTISNSDLELAGGLIHLEALAQTFDVRERTLLSKTDNLNTLFWQRKGSATTEKVPSHLLRLFGIHQRYHRYVSRHDYIPGESNPLADGLSRDFNLTWDEQMEVLAPHLPTPREYQIWTPTEEFMDAILGALLRKRVPPESLIVAPSQPAPVARPPSGSPTLTWPSAPYSKPSRAKFEKYTSSDQDFCKEKLRPSEIPLGLSRLKVTYGSVPRRPRAWGPRSR